MIIEVALSLGALVGGLGELELEGCGLSFFALVADFGDFGGGAVYFSRDAGVKLAETERICTDISLRQQQLADKNAIFSKLESKYLSAKNSFNEHFRQDAPLKKSSSRRLCMHPSSDLCTKKPP